MELGSEFHLNLEELHTAEDSVFQYMEKFSCLFFDSGRSALFALYQTIRPTVIFLPEYLCESVLQPILDECSIFYYPLSPSFEPDFSGIPDIVSGLDQSERARPFLYIMHYFGKLISDSSISKVRELKQMFDFQIIEDTTHSLLSSPLTVGDFGICSLRKWFPIPDGGVLYSELPLPAITGIQPGRVNQKAYGAILKSLFLKGLGDFNDLYRTMFTKAEEALDSQNNIFAMSDYSKFLLSCFSISTIRQKRTENYNNLLDFFESYNPAAAVFPKLSGTPFVFPVLAKNRDALRSYLIEHQIYCAVHWPVSHTPFEHHEAARHFSAHLLSLPVDQRYGTAHMEYLKNTLQQYTVEKGELLWD